MITNSIFLNHKTIATPGFNQNVFIINIILLGWMSFCNLLK